MNVYISCNLIFKVISAVLTTIGGIINRSMDFLDPKLQRRRTIQLLVGYVFVGIAILFATLILLYMAFGFGYGKNGTIIQKGFVYVSSTPTGSTISVSGQTDTHKTNARLALPSGNYKLTITRDGYRTWQRPISVEGSSVTHFDYPFLFPNTLSSSKVKSYAAAPVVVSQSPDQRWLLVKPTTADGTFEEYDLKNPKATPVSLTLPTSIDTGATSLAWQAMEWASDNKHVLLSRTLDGKPDFVLFDRDDPTQSVDLNDKLNITPTKISLINKKYDQYYVYNASDQSLQKITLGDTTLTPFLQHVLAYQSYGTDIMLYASSSSSGSDKVSIDLLQDGKTYALREVAANTNYVINLTQYSGDWYVALGASSEGKVYIYKNPVSQLRSDLGVLVPIYVMKTANPNYLAFSNNAQFIMEESGTQFSVYDAENDDGYNYDTKQALDAPQTHATWMDGDRITYVSDGKLMVFDYDHANPQTLIAANPSYTAVFDVDYKFLDTFTSAATDGSVKLQTTQLRAPADQ